MRADDLEALAFWTAEQGLTGLPDDDLLRGFAERCRAAGLPLARAVLVIDTLHPTREGRAIRWHGPGGTETPLVDYGHSDSGAARESWERSPFHALDLARAGELRRRLLPDDPAPDFPVLLEQRAAGITDYLALVRRFGAGGSLGTMDTIYSSWSSDAPGGFAEADLAALRRLYPALALAVKCSALARMSRSLAEVYLGRDPAQQVMAGRVRRGVPERLNAVLWFSDLRGYTGITDTAPPDEIMPLLNDYADAVISAVHEAGGDVLKLMGDGTLAIFKAADPAAACRAALAAEADLRARLRALKHRRRAEGRPATTLYLGLHLGDVFYGNIGSAERLDFTVVGAAVNEVSRIATLCRSVDRHLLISEAFQRAVPAEERARLVSVGRYALRGVGRAQDLYTLDPALL
jgi:adenylate cyclase